MKTISYTQAQMQARIARFSELKPLPIQQSDIPLAARDVIYSRKLLSVVGLEQSTPINAGARHDIESGLAAGQFSGISVETGVFMMLSMIASAVDYFSVARKPVAGESVACQMATMFLWLLGLTPNQGSTSLPG